MDTLSRQQIHQLAMQEVGDHLKANGFEFLAVNSQPKRTPQFVCVKEKALYFIVVKGCLYPQAPKSFDPKEMNKVKDHAQKNKAQLFYAMPTIMIVH
ncbi:MAG: Na(+)-translocating NADH-quinone reductase subunit F [Flavobacteriaceae bacterium]